MQSIAELISLPRLRCYLDHVHGDLEAAVELYAWNARVSAAFGETSGILEVVLRNALAKQMNARHIRGRHPGSWLDDHARELTPQARADIAKARNRVERTGKRAVDDQVITQLGFGFWRFLVIKRYSSTLWLDLQYAFPHAPKRNRRYEVETRVAALHEFRNRMAHHEPVWNKPLKARLSDLRDVVNYVSPEIGDWWNQGYCSISQVLDTCPVSRPHP
ncbi:hypothetical protein Q5530_27795 [Saccharothrix sp. BKS2]|uniref:hypothetical protein n=1 Tax=Saccharothrix sp. BKS2 TaxID=3064400 RepID=UPI0039E80C5E